MYAAKSGNAPFIIATDLNVQLDKQEQMPTLMLTEILFGRLVDVDLLYAQANCSSHRCSYHNGSSTQSPTRIDTLFADRMIANTVIKASSHVFLVLMGNKSLWLELIFIMTIAHGSHSG